MEPDRCPFKKFKPKFTLKELPLKIPRRKLG
jgi:hypothetical protein